MTANVLTADRPLVNFPGYSVFYLLSEDRNFRLYRAIRNQDKRPVFIKAPNPSSFSSKAVHKLEYEYKIISQLDPKSILSPLDLVRFPDAVILVLEDGNFERLDLFDRPPLEIETFLKIAISIVESLQSIHKAGIIHKNIKPEQLFIQTQTREIRVTGFEIASILPRENQANVNLKLIEGSLPYMAPEQTGRINRAMDNRTDLYSLGITFYELLTGTLPFLADDPIEWVHCHVAMLPKFSKEMNLKISDALSEIILKLLEKDAEKRYQSAHGLKLDLKQCLSQLESHGEIRPFPLGRQDFFESFQIPQKLFGRAHELDTLLTTFERVAKFGQSELVLVAGRAGVGKTALINELHSAIVKERGFFTSGKFDQYKRDIPYSTLVEAFKSLIKEISGRDEKEVQVWKGKFQEMLGASSQVIIDFVPELGTLLGPQSSIVALSLDEAEKRLQISLRKFIQVFCERGHPLVLFLDDLQWADPASLRMIEYLAGTDPLPYLLLLGAYRDNEVDVSHSLFQTISKLKKADIRITEFTLEPLTSKDLIDLIVETSHGAKDQAPALADLVFQKTGGNPLFAIQFLTAMYKEGLASFDPGNGTWHWDLSKIGSKGFADNIIDLMTEKIRKFSETTLEVLTTAACVGNSVDSTLLATICNQSSEWVEKNVLEAVREGLLLKYQNAYKFLHDRVRQAAYQILHENDRLRQHLKIGRLLHSQAMQLGFVNEGVFDIVNHLNQAVSLIRDEDEKQSLASLNLIAAQRAKSTAALKSAADYFERGKANLKLDMWESQYNLAFELSLGIASCEYLLGNSEGAIHSSRSILSKTKSAIEKTKVYHLLVEIYTTIGNPTQALEVGIEGLKTLDIFIPLKPDDLALKGEYNRLQKGLEGREIESLSLLPEMHNPKMESALNLLQTLFVPAGNCCQKLPPLIYMHMVNISMIHGNANASALAYAYLGMILGPFYGRYQDGYRFGRVALELVNRRQSHPYKAQTYFIFGNQILFWVRHQREDLEYLHIAFQESVAHSDTTTAANCSLHITTVHFYKGDPLDETYQESEKRLEFLRKTGFDAWIQLVIGVQRPIQALRGLTSKLSYYSDEHFDESEYDSFMGQYAYPIVPSFYYLGKIQTCYIFRDYSRALAAGRKSQEGIWSAPQVIQPSELKFYFSLTLAALYEAAPAKQKQEYLEIISDDLNQFSVWAANCPENFEGKYHLIAAELAKIRGQELEAEKLYEKGIQSALKNDYTQIAAIGNELAADFNRKRGLETIFNAYLREAHRCYKRWGAKGKVRQMEQLYPQLMEPLPLAPTSTFALGIDQLDLLSVVKASQIISKEIVFDRVIRALFQIVIELGGAEKGYLILAGKETLTLNAHAETIDKRVIVSIPQPEVLSSSHLPVSIIEHVYRTGEKFILNSGAHREKFSQDPYMSSVRPRSALCIPIVRQTKPVGLLYLENNLASGAFTQDRLLGLELIAAQAAISIENSLFYSELERQKNKLQSILDNTTAVIYVKDLEFKYLLVNRRWEVIFGYTRDQVIGKTDFSFFPKEQVEAFRANDIKVLEGNRPIESEEVVSHPDGLHTYISIKFPLADSEGKVYGICGISTDITERKRTEEERMRLLAHVQEALQIRDDFISIAAHELRTPLTPLKMQVQMLKRALEKPRELAETKTPDSSLVIKIIEQEMNRLCKLVEDLLDISRVRAGKLVLQRAWVDLPKLIDNVLTRFRSEFEKSNCSLEVSHQTTIHGYWDSSRIEQVLINLITNAIKFGSGKPIRIGSMLEGDYAKIIVQDHGIGIKKDDQTRIFDRFERGVSIMSFGGLGLGLYISKQIVQAHGGRIQMESEPGTGSVFTVEIPLKERDD